MVAHKVERTTSGQRSFSSNRDSRHAGAEVQLWAFALSIRALTVGPLMDLLWKRLRGRSARH